MTSAASSQSSVRPSCRSLAVDPRRTRVVAVTDNPVTDTPVTDNPVTDNPVTDNPRSRPPKSGVAQMVLVRDLVVDPAQWNQGEQVIAG